MVHSFLCCNMSSIFLW